MSMKIKMILNKLKNKKILLQTSNKINLMIKFIKKINLKQNLQKRNQMMEIIWIRIKLKEEI